MVQEKAIAFPTDSRLYHKARRILVALAKRRGIDLRQTYERLGKRGVQPLHGNPYDGHTLKDALKQTEQLTGWHPEHAYCDRGYRGETRVMDKTIVHLANRHKKSMKPREWTWFKRRSAIEPIIGHMKSDHRMNRNYLKGEDGDKINAILAECGFNLRKLIRAILLWLFKERIIASNTHWMTLIQRFSRNYLPV